MDGTKVIGSDLSESYLQYTMDVTDTTLFDDNFVEAFAWYLAAQIAVPIVGAEKGREMRRDALQLYTSFMTEAKANNANERSRKPPADSDTTLLRMF